MWTACKRELPKCLNFILFSIYNSSPTVFVYHLIVIKLVLKDAAKVSLNFTALHKAYHKF